MLQPCNLLKKLSWNSFKIHYKLIQNWMTYFSLGQQKVYLHTMYITFLCYFISFHESKLVIPVITYSLKKTSIAHWLISVTFELKCKFCGLLFDSQVTKWVKFCAYNKNIYNKYIRFSFFCKIMVLSLFHSQWSFRHLELLFHQYRA